MDRYNTNSYIPYLGRENPRNLSFERSIAGNPIEENFHVHIAWTRKALEDHERRLYTEDEAEQYRYRPWFSALREILEGMVEMFLDFRRMDMSVPTYQKYRKLSASLEVICSIIIFSDHVLYKWLQDEEIEDLKFPLSKPTRLLVNKVSIGNGDDIVTVKMK